MPTCLIISALTVWPRLPTHTEARDTARPPAHLLAVHVQRQRALQLLQCVLLLPRPSGMPQRRAACAGAVPGCVGHGAGG